MLTALRTRIYRCIARKYGGRLHASSLRPGYFGGDEAALQQHSNDATFRRRSFREWPRAPTHSGRRLTREAFSIFIVRRADFRRLQTLSVPVPFKVISKRTGFDRALEFNIYGLRLPFGRKYVITSTKEFDRLPKHLLRGPLAPTRIARMHQRHSRAGVMQRHRTTTPLPFENETDPCSSPRVLNYPRKSGKPQRGRRGEPGGHELRPIFCRIRPRPPMRRPSLSGTQAGEAPPHPRVAS